MVVIEFEFIYYISDPDFSFDPDVQYLLLTLYNELYDTHKARSLYFSNSSK